MTSGGAPGPDATVIGRVEAALSGGGRWQDNRLTFGFSGDADDYGALAPSVAADFVPFTDEQSAAARQILDEVAAFTGLTFTERPAGESGGTTLQFGQFQSLATGVGFLPNSGTQAGNVWLSSTGDFAGEITTGSYAWYVLTHEIGHALGLTHGHGELPTELGAMTHSVMTYRSYVGQSDIRSLTVEDGGFAQGFMAADIAALQALYGANYAVRAGNTTYSWDPETGERFVDGVGLGAPAAARVFHTVWDGGGTDTYDASAFADGVRLDLRPGASSVLSEGLRADLAAREASGESVLADNVYNAFLHQNDRRALIENARGGAGDDTLTGNQAANRLVGGGGADQLKGLGADDRLFGGGGQDRLLGGGGDDLLSGGGGSDLLFGGAGEDTARLGDRMADLVLVRSADGAVSVTDGTGTVDLLRDIERIEFADLTVDVADLRTFAAPSPVLAEDTFAAAALDDPTPAASVRGSKGADIVLGSDRAEVVRSGLGHDRVSGGGGDDDIRGGKGRDSLFGGQSDDALRGHGGRDVIAGGAGRDQLWGGAGRDRFLFEEGFGTDRVMDFQMGIDRLDLRRLDLPSADAVEVRDHARGTALVVPDGKIILDGVEPGDLSATDFLL